MSLKIGDTAPDFEAETTEGKLRFHDWIGESWCVESGPSSFPLSAIRVKRFPRSSNRMLALIQFSWSAISTS